MQYFSNILYNLLRQRDISQKTLAEMTHTTEATISRYLTANRSPRIDLVVSIAQALGVTTDYLLGLTAIPTGTSLTADVEELVSLYYSASNEDRRVIWAVLEKYRSVDYKIAASGQDKWKSSESDTRQGAVKKFEDK